MSHTIKSDYTGIRKRVIVWYGKNGRTFPWRETTDVYRVLVAEMMLRRTTATAVVRAFSRFIQTFPTIASLAASPLEDIRECIQCLGLQTQRALHFKNMAISVKEEYNGDIISTRDTLHILPGVGRYVAAAVRNFAFGLPEPMVDGNVLHFLRRVFGVSIESPDNELAWDIMKSLGGRKQDRRLYWGIIDLVAAICLRKNPRCSRCPIEDICTFTQ